jgi:organic radical activating enzyme
MRTFLETSGSSPLSGKWDWICLSPKQNIPPLAENIAVADELKVIIAKEFDFSWAERYADKVKAACKLYLQPEWSQHQKMMPAIIDYVMQHPKWMISLQSHKYMHIP